MFKLQNEELLNKTIINMPWEYILIFTNGEWNVYNIKPPVIEKEYLPLEISAGLIKDLIFKKSSFLFTGWITKEVNEARQLKIHHQCVLIERHPHGSEERTPGTINMEKAHVEKFSDTLSFVELLTLKESVKIEEYKDVIQIGINHKRPR